MKRIIFSALAVLSLAACSDDAQVVSKNLARAADNFEINRRVIFYNGISGEYILTIEGLCSIEAGNPLRVTCKTGSSEFKKHHLGISDNVTWFAEQLAPVKPGAYHYRVTFKPQTIIPDIDVRAGGPAPVPTINR